MRNWQALVGAVTLLLAIGAPGARSADMAQLKPAICSARATCTIAKLTPAGKSDTGAALSVAEVHLGIAEAPDPQFPCHNDEGTANDGGQEYWLVEGSAAPHLLLKLCNDGYGAAGGRDGPDHYREQPFHPFSGGWVERPLGDDGDDPPRAADIAARR